MRDNRGMSHQPAEPGRRPRTSVVVLVAWSMIVVGLGLLGYVGWQFYGTNIVSAHKQQQVVERTERAWRRSGGGGGGARSATGVGTAQALIRIPRFGRKYVMPVQAGVSEQVLAEGFGHFLHTAGPGQKGNYAIAAHRVTHGEPLRNMPELRPGDKVLVETRTKTFTYVLDTNPNDLVVSFTGTWVLDPRPKNPISGGVSAGDYPQLLTMATCSELFHTDNRMIVFGHLVHVTNN